MKSTRRGTKLLPRWIIGTLLVMLSFLAFNPSASAAVTGKIAGIVVDVETGEPLPGANVIIEGTNMGAATDPDGYFFIIRVSPGVYNVQARMMGYTSLTQTGVDVSTDHTTQLRFELKPAVIEGEGITVKAEAQVIKMDLSASSISAKSDDIEAVPFVDDIGDYINRQAGIQGWNVRGGSVDEVGFMTDGLNLVDGRTNNPALMPPLSMVKELNVVKGGFAAEYGNLRSGLINIVTREPSDDYHGAVNFRFSPAHMKHSGPSVYDPEHYWLRAYVSEEDSLCWIGSRGIARKRNGAEDLAEDALEDGDSAAYEEYMVLVDYYQDIIDHNMDFDGWITATRTDTNKTPEQGREEFIWIHRVEGVDELVPDGYDGDPRVGVYGDKPDLNVDASFGGPVPVIGGALGDLGFYVAHRQNREAFALPSSRDYYIEENTMLKLVSHLSQSIKLSYDMMYGEQNTLSASSNGELGAEGNPYGLYLNTGDLGAQFVDWVQGTGYVSGAGGIYLSSGDDVFRSEIASKNASYYPAFIPPYNIYHNMQGLTFDHAVSEKVFYTIRLSHLSNLRSCKAYEAFEERDSTRYVLPSGIEVTEAPYGYYLDAAFVQPDGSWMGAHCAGAVDKSKSQTWDFKVDLTNQINAHNEIKLGFEYNYSDMHTYYEKNRWESPHENWIVDWEANPIRGGAYIQDKIEFEGIIANVGVRADWNDPNLNWFDLDSNAYGYYLTRLAKDQLGQDGVLEEATVPAKGHLKLAPRFGISHPISENAKLYFNYGDFYSLPASYNLYQLFWGPRRYGITYLGDPNLDWPLTRAYELGTDWNIGDMFRLHLAGYYKDVTNQPVAVEYIGYDNSPLYKIPESANIEDIRGIDFRLSKDFGNWVKGWVNYDYRVRTYGQTGKQTHYQDLLQEATAGSWDSLESTPRAQPLLEANVQFLTPEDMGLLLGKISLSFNYSWQAGSYTTYDPLHEDPTDPERKYLNMQWKPWKNFQARIQKGISFAGTNLSVFAEINNLFDWKYLDASSGSFVNDDDEDKYYSSLHLPLYGEEGYGELGEVGDDQFGDVSSDDKPYIDDPDLTHLAFHNPRSFVFGVKVDF